MHDASTTRHAMTRRHALCQTGTGMGLLGLLVLLGDTGYLGTALQGAETAGGATPSPAATGRCARADAEGRSFSRQGQACDSHLLEWRAVAGRHLRSQAAVEEV